MPYATSMARTANFNCNNVAQIFRKLETVLESLKVRPSDIWNLGVMDITAVQTLSEQWDVELKKKIIRRQRNSGDGYTSKKYCWVLYPILSLLSQSKISFLLPLGQSADCKRHSNPFGCTARKKTIFLLNTLAPVYDVLLNISAFCCWIFLNLKYQQKFKTISKQME